MQLPDLNLLIALDALLEEGSVAGAARRMHLSAPAMSRTLARIREAVGDPILVKIGRRMVPTPRAMALREHVHQSVDVAVRLLQPEAELVLATLERHINIYASDTFSGSFGNALLERVQREAPRVVLHFQPAQDIDAHVVLNGKTDLYIGAMRTIGPDIHVQPLFTSRFVGVAREGHPIFNETMDAEVYAGYAHIRVSRRGRNAGPIDTALSSTALQRRVSLVVPSFYAAAFALGFSDLITTMPEHIAVMAQRLGMRLRTFELPVVLDPIVLIQAWHPRVQSDPAHQWLRRMVREVCEA